MAAAPETSLPRTGSPRRGPARPAPVIAEIAQAHDGSLGQAHAYIDCAAAAGADAVKFQTHIASAESTAAEPWRVKFSGRTRPASTTGAAWSFSGQYDGVSALSP